MAGTESVSQDDLIVCACGNQEFTARDAIDAALFRGELDSKWKEFVRCVESEKRADELDLRSEEHTSELQSRFDLVCRLLLEKKKSLNFVAALRNCSRTRLPIEV